MGNDGFDPSTDCIWYTSWICDGCRDPENCASYIPKQVKAKVEVKQDKQLTLFDL